MVDMQKVMDVLDIYFLGWPLIIITLAVGIICTVALNFIQIRYFFTSWKYVFFPEKQTATTSGNVTPIQAFINTLSANIGNGSFGGMATALYAGGPGAAFWVVAIGIIMMAVRFAEVYLSTYTAALQGKASSGIGGPMLYLRKVPGGTFLPVIYGVIIFIFSLLAGNALQTNTMGLALQTTWNISLQTSAIIFFLFLIYVVTGGSQRISKASEAIVPLKVGTFFLSSIIILCYHWQAIIPSLQLIWKGAFTPLALAGGVIGFSVKQAMRYGISRAIFATESGLGTAGVLFGFTGSKTPVQDGILSMLSAFISTIVCFIIALCIIASGVKLGGDGATSSALTIAAYQTVFGTMGGWIATFLSVTFGLGVIVSFAYIAKESWLFLTGGRFGYVVDILYCIVAFVGVLTETTLMWQIVEILNGTMLIINLFGIIYLIPLIIHGVRNFRGQENN